MADKTYLLNIPQHDAEGNFIGYTSIPALRGVQGEQGFGYVAHLYRTEYTQAKWEELGTIGHHTGWRLPAQGRNGCRIGDFFSISGVATDTKRSYTIIYISTTSQGLLEGDCVSKFFVEPGEKGDKGDNSYYTFKGDDYITIEDDHANNITIGHQPIMCIDGGSASTTNWGVVTTETKKEG